MGERLQRSGDRTMVSVRLTKAEQDALRSAAEKRGESVSGFVRRVSLTEAGVRRSAPLSSAPTRTVTVGAVLQYADSGRFRSTALVPPATGAQQGTNVLPSSGERIKLDMDPEEALRVLLRTPPLPAADDRS